MAEWLKLSKNVYRKELLPIGSYRKDSDDLDFEISLEMLEHMQTTASGMLAAGVQIPLVKSHDGDSAFGQVVGLSVDKDKGTSFVDIEFADDGCCAEAMRNDVSAFIPPEFVDGKGNAWKRPLRHVAITPYPVIPGLGKWESIAASFHDFKERKTPMLDDLTKALSLEFDDGDDKETREKRVIEDVKTLANQALELSEELKVHNDRRAKVAEKMKEMKERRRQKKESNGPTKYPQNVVLAFGRARSREINDLVHESKITPAVAKGLMKKYCSGEEITLSLANDGPSDFDDLMKIMAQNQSIPMSGRRPSDRSIRLSHDGKPSSLVAVAKKRADAAKR